MVTTHVRTDLEIKKDVLEELKWDTRVDETEVGVQVEKGVVVLTGMVSSYAKKIAAQKAAHRVKGVLDVANDLEIHLPGTGRRTDPEIARAVRHALEWDVLLPDDQIRSTVTQGWVTLEGEVGSWAQREDAYQAASRLVGVTGVTNRIEVAAEPVDTVELKSWIQDALERQADREAQRLHIEVKPGNKVVLEGHVHSWAERRAILGSVESAPGVRSVEDHLIVAPYE